MEIRGWQEGLNALNDPKERKLIFVQNKKNADFMATYLSGEGLPTTSIHGDRRDDWSCSLVGT